jgi:hypothetical protein
MIMMKGLEFDLQRVIHVKGVYGEYITTYGYNYISVDGSTGEQLYVFLWGVKNMEIVNR